MRRRERVAALKDSLAMAAKRYRYYVLECFPHTGFSIATARTEKFQK
jgi:hypothetical protein